MVMAVAIAIALHEIIAGLFPSWPQPQPERVAHVEVADITRATPTPRPSPSPTPPPPPTPAPARSIDPAAQSHRETIVRQGAARPKAVTIYHSKPVWDVPRVGGQGAGEGHKSGAGSTGSGNANGTGSGGAGNGTGTVPCGYVEFQPVPQEAPKYDRATGFFVYDNIKMTVHMPGGDVQDVALDWAWRYKREDGDPFTHPDAPMLFEFPPQEQRASEPALVQYVMQHTSPEGFTTLEDCPSAAP